MTRLEEQRDFNRAAIADYKPLAPDTVRKTRAAAKRLKGLAVIHVNATPVGGGVAEMLKSQIPLERSLGLRSHWLTIKTDRSRFFDITKKMHNLLQGKPGRLKDEEKRLYLEINKELGQSLRRFCSRAGRGIVVLHDPQPLAAVKLLPDGFTPVLRIHIDLLTPNYGVLYFLRPYIAEYKSVIISNPDYLPALSFLPPARIKIITPAIDPFTEKNRPMERETAKLLLEGFGINPKKPLVSQISRFDPWKDPLGVIKAYYLAKNRVPDMQLALAGYIVAKDDPEALAVFAEVRKHAKGDPDIFLFSDIRTLKNVSHDAFVNALQTASDVVIQKSIREGFGLTMTEAMWKENAVVAGRTSGAKMQIQNGKNGILVTSPRETAAALVRLLKNPGLRERLGKAARRTVKSKFLMPSYILRHLRCYASVKP